MTNATNIELRAAIASHYDGSHFSPISALYNRNGDARKQFLRNM